MHKPSSYLQEAFELLEAAKEKISTASERQKRAVDLAALILEEANRIATPSEKKRQKELARMMEDPRGKAFTTCMTDECFRSHKAPRVADQMVYLLSQFGVPKYLDRAKRLALMAFQKMGKNLSYLLVPIAKWILRRQTRTVILPGEKLALKKHMRKRRNEGVRLNLNHLGEAILGEEEANARLSVYLHDLAEDDVEYVSVKISTIFSQINLLAWDQTLETLAERLRRLFEVAKVHTFTHSDGSKTPKFVNLDMEEYRDLRLTVDLFKKVLGSPQFHDFSAGIVLQAYLPDAHDFQKELTVWAMERVKNKGAPIKIRIVKGANLAMEQFEASLKDWPQAPYKQKSLVDANYKRMVAYGMVPEKAKAVHLGIASHNLFDIAYGLILRAEYGVEREVSFEMLEGMADHMRRVVQKLSKDILLYCPVATREDFQSAVAYLIRRLDENTGPENFLRHTFGLKPGTEQWKIQVARFEKACEEMQTAPLGSRRVPHAFVPKDLFDNESDTDFALEENRKWVFDIVKTWKEKKLTSIPSVIAGQEFHEKTPGGQGRDPSRPGHVLYTYSLADKKMADTALSSAKNQESKWSATPAIERAKLLGAAAQKMREKRGDFIGVMLADGGKTRMRPILKFRKRSTLRSTTNAA